MDVSSMFSRYSGLEIALPEYIHFCKAKRLDMVGLNGLQVIG